MSMYLSISAQPKAHQIGIQHIDGHGDKWLQFGGDDGARVSVFLGANAELSAVIVEKLMDVFGPAILARTTFAVDGDGR